MRILLVDDDHLSRKSIAKFARTYLNHEVDEADSASKAWDMYQKNHYPLVISDIRMPGMSGLDLLSDINKQNEKKQTKIVMITGFGELQTAIQALRSGAYDFMEKPIDVEELSDVIKRVEEHFQFAEENEILRNEVEQQKSSVQLAHGRLRQLRTAYTEIFGYGRVGIFSDKMRKIIDLANSFHSDRDMSVLIKGETGTGKEIIARMVHYHEGEELLPFITVNCSAISPTLFESEVFGYEPGAFTGAKSKGQIGKLELAQGGTLFLDEIGDLPLDLQPKLLTALQMKEFYKVGGKRKIKLDIRFVCATNRDLEDMMNKGTFRKDLFFRLNTGYIDIPPLAERQEEIPQLAQMFLNEFAQKKNKKFRIINQDAIQLLRKQSWPGNVRELRNVIERAVLLYNTVELTVIQLKLLTNFQTDFSVSNESQLVIDLPEKQYHYAQMEKEIIEQLLRRYKGNKTQVAKYLSITRNRLNRKLNC